MIGTIRWNFTVAGVAALLTLVLSWPNNRWWTALFDAFQAFVVLFAAVFAVRWLLGTVFGLKEKPLAKGTVIDFTTPEDPGADEFRPLAPPDVTAEVLRAWGREDEGPKK